jgi:transcriptional/translational regulatory protein YebC/TACO1
VTCAPDDLSTVRDALETRFGPASAAKLAWKPQALVPVEDEAAAVGLFKLVEALEDSDDVQTVYGNYDVPDELIAKLEG